MKLNPAPKKTNFETTTCRRCLGTGQFAFNLLHGTTCYGCHGTGRQFTIRGYKALQAFLTSWEKKAEEVEVGDWFPSEPSIGTVPGSKKFRVVAIEETEIGFVYHGNPVTIHGVEYPVSRSQRAGQIVRILPEADRYAVLLEKALEFQASLPESGSSRKASKKAEKTSLLSSEECSGFRVQVRKTGTTFTVEVRRGDEHLVHVRKTEVQKEAETLAARIAKSGRTWESLDRNHWVPAR